MKHFRHILLLALALLIGEALSAQQDLNTLMRERGEYYFTLSVDDPAQIQELGRVCSIDGTDGHTVVAYANQQEYDRLLSLGYQPNLQTPPCMQEETVMWDGTDRASYAWDSYPTYDAYQSMMEAFPSQAQATGNRSCTLLDLGTLNSGRKILGVRLNNGQPDGKPKFLYSSTMHGDEVTGMMLMLRLIDEFCTSTDTRIVNLLNSLDIFIFPLTNPDGTYYGGNSTMNSARRYNINGVDLNRNYKDYYIGEHPDNKAYALETQWTMQLAQDYLFTMGANYHGGAEVANYPWDAISGRHPDDAWYQYVCLDYVSRARAINSSYMTDTYSSGITNGYDWYQITGSRQDYENAYGQCREITMECSTTKKPAASTMPTYWNYNHDAMLGLLEQCLNGVHGFVYDAVTGASIEGVTITVENHDNGISTITSHNIGDFHRPIKGGTWTLVFSKAGYHPETVNVTVADGQSENITVYLTPYGPNEKDCYEQTMPSAAGEYVMGYLNNETLVMPSHNSSSTVTTTSLDVTVTDDGFSVGAGTTIPKVTLTAYVNDQYYISYNGRYLARSNYGSSLTWGTSTSQYGRWNINSNGIYVTRNNTNYYLYYNNGSFQLSTTQQNNIHFYVKGDCTVTQTINFAAGWNWWAPSADLSLGQLEEALGSNGILINSQASGFVRYEGGQWTGTLETLTPGEMYMIQTNADCTFSITGPALSTTTVNIQPGHTWFSYTGTQSASISEVFGTSFGPSSGDKIISQADGFAIFENGSWGGTLTTLTPGNGYIYYSIDSEPKLLIFNAR